MLVVKTIKKEVKCCNNCPYYYEDKDMGTTLFCCELNGFGYSAILSDINWNNASKIISKDCKYNLDKTLNT